MITQYVCILILGLILYQIVYTTIIKTKRNPPKYFYLLAFILLIPGILIPFHYLHILDNQLWYYKFRSIDYIEYSLVFIAPFFAMLAIRIKKIRFVFLLCFILSITLPYLKYIYSPLYTSLLKSNIIDGITIQTTPSTCGPSALASILRLHGIEKTEKELAKLCYTTQSGTEVWHIKRYLKSISINSEFVIDSNCPPPYPSIAGIIVQGGMGHFISILNLVNNKYIIGDSMYGKKQIALNEVKKRIHFTGFYLIIQSNIRKSN